jgi:hypothetical protein
VRMIKTVRLAVEAIPEDARQGIDYPEEGEAQIAQTVYGRRRLIIRRTRPIGAQTEPWPDWRHFCLITNRTDDIALVEAEHRDHAVVEQVIGDLKDQALAHFPPASSTPTRPGPSSPPWRTTCCAGHNCSDRRTQPSAPPAPCAAGC